MFKIIVLVVSLFFIGSCEYFKEIRFLKKEKLENVLNSKLETILKTEKKIY